MASSLELNKLIAGVLTAGIIAVGAGVIASILYHPAELEENAFNVIEAESEGGETVETADTPDELPLATLLASADPAAGETITRQCTACHVFNEGGENRVGPGLWNVVGNDVASHDGFAYSEALMGIEGDWTYEALDGFLAAPRDWAPGTAMSYAGVRDAQDRANLIAYLRSLSSDPVPLPEPAAAEAAAVEAETEEATDTAATELPAESEETAVVEAEAEDAAEAEVAATEVPAESEETAVVEAEAEEVAEAEVTATEAPAESEETAVVEAEAEEVEVAEAEAPAAEAAGEASPMVAMVSAADPADGEKLFRQCAACHVPDQGGDNRVGPGLWGVFGADIGTHEGFNYSDALQGLEGNWTVEKLNAYLENPRAYAPGNRMAFAGLRSEEDRVAMIAYLHSLSESPVPLQ